MVHLSGGKTPCQELARSLCFFYNELLEGKKTILIDRTAALVGLYDTEIMYTAEGSARPLKLPLLSE
jgi:hypothetical protein